MFCETTVIFAVTAVISGETTIMFVAIIGMFVGIAIMPMVPTVMMFHLASRMCRATRLCCDIYTTTIVLHFPS